ncbi:hypothetical protein HA402_004353 [Bradysia odoriphaga]|nr:hypothetical protein HA402_004353 [Bradysia odoriphaga]
MSGVTVAVELVFCKPKEPEICSDEVASECSEKTAESCSAETLSSPSCDMSSTCDDSCSFEPEEGLGKVTRNPFFNFLRDFRKCRQGMSAKEIAVDGGEKWRAMDEKDKAKYIVQAFRTPKKYYRSRKNNTMESSEPAEPMEAEESMESELTESESLETESMETESVE